MNPYDHSPTAASTPEFLLQEALQTKCHSTAQQLLDAIPTLTRQQAADCALLALGWAPDLLEQILDKTSGPPFVWLRHQVTLDAEKQLVLSLRGSLVMIAAALDDLPALNILLTRGGHPDYDFRRDRWDIVGDLLMGEVTMGALNSPEYSIGISRPFPDDTPDELRGADPLSAAIFCNARDCAARLLEESSVTVTPAVRRALARTPVNETQTLVARKLTVPLEELLLPEDFGPEMVHPLLPEVLKRHGGAVPRETVKAFVANLAFTKDEDERTRQMDLLGLIRADLLGDVVWEIWRQTPHRKDLLDLASRFALPVNRCQVPDQLRKDTVQQLLEHFHITENIPEDGLSGLACSLLQLLKGNDWNQALSVEQLLCLPGAKRILSTEHPEQIVAWLETQQEIPPQQKLSLLALLNIQKEASYEL